MDLDFSSGTLCMENNTIHLFSRRVVEELSIHHKYFENIEIDFNDNINLQAFRKQIEIQCQLMLSDRRFIPYRLRRTKIHSVLHIISQLIGGTESKNFNSFLEQVDSQIQKMLFSDFKRAVKTKYNKCFNTIDMMHIQCVNEYHVTRWLHEQLQDYHLNVSRYIGWYDKPMDDVDGDERMVVFFDTKGDVYQREFEDIYTYKVSEDWEYHTLWSGLDNQTVFDAGKNVKLESSDDDIDEIVSTSSKVTSYPGGLSLAEYKRTIIPKFY